MQFKAEVCNFRATRIRIAKNDDSFQTGFLLSPSSIIMQTNR